MPKVKQKLVTYTAIVCDGNGEWHIFKRKCDDATNDYLGSPEAFADELRLQFNGNGGLVTYYRDSDVVEKRWI